ncbi:MAG: VWA domain-containing protein [Lachnospiraceae bacterium]|nr:VWA domain-containing protein [Lachnospiraceae bacterium]
MHELCYPFAAIVGQERVKRALLLNLVNPQIGGVLLAGEKGTAKSTIVRGIARLGEKQVVDLPLNATEDMLIGSIDFEATIQEGSRQFAGGILSRANNNILYVDEINLLADSMAASVVCAASSGENLVEREGISYRHACKFILIGTMNPEEGGLRPQLLDKFGLYVNVGGEKDLETRIQIIRSRLEYERNPKEFVEKWEKASSELKKKVQEAMMLVSQVQVSESIRILASRLAEQAACEGNRAELLLIETACAVAALDGRRHVTVKDMQEASEYVLPHRRRELQQPEETLKKENESVSEEAETQTNNQSEESIPQPMMQEESDAGLQEDGDRMDAEYVSDSLNEEAPVQEEQLVTGEEIYQVIRLPGEVRDRITRKGNGRRRRTNSGANKGRYAGFTMSRTQRNNDIALDATLRAAAPYQKSRDKGTYAVAVEECDFRYKKRENHVGATILFVVDASGSMGAARRMKETKEAVLSMLMDSYQKRDKVGLIAFRQKQAEVLMGITTSVDLAQKELQTLPTGGRTPLADGLYSAWQLFCARKRKDPEMLPLLVLVTDGRANSALWSNDPVEDAIKAAGLIANERIPAIVVDTENDFLSFHLAERIAEAMHATYFKVNELKSSQLRGIISLRQNSMEFLEKE